ncbi:TetR/AcrR family transcriptional regulator [Corallococcus aberystwythensis]|uniref:TetR/AcrR family transcriptional regulator n=1 Tax=Corallococcus aberystwythensis TaxID=2316722 RepID=A0A3A8Q3Z9_9BACT|nr:TetR/AcrR family transcriptional regulator [Corallococcus aberystwythensis]RKH63447.1 TetR/AcrR family transcriptional regulator [Corallococcus aberystwythensis]
MKPPSDQAGEAPRDRLVAGLAQAILEVGYGRLTIADIVRHARVSKRTFYEHFEDKEACLLALYATHSARLLEEVEAAIQHAPPGELRASIGAAVYLSSLQSRPGLVRTLLVEILHVGPKGFALRRRVMRSFAELMRREFASAGTGDALSPALAMALVGGINELILEAVEEDRVDRLSELAGPVAAFVRGLLEARTAAK